RCGPTGWTAHRGSAPCTATTGRPCRRRRCPSPGLCHAVASADFPLTSHLGRADRQVYGRTSGQGARREHLRCGEARPDRFHAHAARGGDRLCAEVVAPDQRLLGGPPAATAAAARPTDRTTR